MEVHKIEILVVDFDNMGVGGVIDELENTEYANHCISPIAISTKTVDVDWDDDHPLNSRSTIKAEVDRLFG